MLLRITKLYISLQCNQKQNVGYKPGGASREPQKKLNAWRKSKNPAKLFAGVKPG